MELRRSAERLIAVQAARLRAGGGPALAWTLRLTGAAVTSYVAADALSDASDVLLAPLTALLVVQATPVSLLVSGVDRVVAVVAGVSVAVGFTEVVQLSWWSLGLIIGVSLLVAQALNLGANRAEVPISAMLVLGVGSFGAQTAASQRISQTLIGAAVGVLTTLVIPPRIATEDAAAALEGLADAVADLLDDAAEELAGLEPSSGAVTGAASGWLGRARRLTHDIPGVGAALLRAEEGRRLNLRALGTRDTGPGLRHGMEALEHSAVTVRGMFRAFADAGGAQVWDDEDVRDDVRDAVALVLHEQAAGMRAFGRLVRAEARPSTPAPVEELREALEGMLEARARLIDLVLVDDPEFTELSTILLATVRRLLTELDLDARLRRLPVERARRRLGPAASSPTDRRL